MQFLHYHFLLNTAVWILGHRSYGCECHEDINYRSVFQSVLICRCLNFFKMFCVDHKMAKINSLVMKLIFTEVCEI